ncbi:hypothetical protein [Paraburkholderia youngii]|uniref:Uncharacterized protein n=1 Tax=Paraburkholderia youngii TaxID=2782701 RepID=A0ABX2NZ53_9BURK|nr:hypothetical protein [Paraburkholderia youngii]NVI09135.1 hypothetical protein [Paraburkholderia youngii]
MLKRLLHRLGYTPASTLSLVPHSAAQHGERALHQLHADGFQWSNARADALCAWHEDGEGYHYAIGRENWAPLAVAGLSLIGNGQCRAWLDETVQVRLGIGQDVLASWYSANRPVLDGLRASIDACTSPDAAASMSGAERDIAPLLKAGEIAELFALTWRRYHLASPFSRLGNSAPYNRLAVHHALRIAAQTNLHALERALEWLTLWLEARGMRVDREAQSVELPGYQALYFRSDAGMWP